MNLGAFQPGGAALPSAKVEMSVRCEGLMDRDLASTSDPTCILFQQQGSKWLEVGRTEKIVNSLNPSWTRKFLLDYKFEERQILKAAVYDIDSSSKSLEDHDFLGSAEFSLGEVMASQSKGFSRPLSRGGTVSIHSEEVSGCRETVIMQLKANKLDDKDWMGKSDPYLEISRANEGSDKWSVVHRTEVVDNNLNPTWAKFSLGVQSLCNGDYNRTLCFSVYDHDDDGSHDLIGSFETNLARLTRGPGPDNVYDCINEKRRKKKGAKYTNSGTVILNALAIESNPTFLDYIQSGTQVNFTLAVDFTGSNGTPSHPSSLHYQDPQGRPNQYVSAIKAVGEIIQDYDSDKMFPALGFGARVPPSGQVSHEFFLNLSPDNPFCHGLDGLLSAYYNSLNNVQLYGPTNFSPVINHVAKFASAYQASPSNYFVLLIITDGIITDLEETKSSIISASSLPLSIIIIGVGDEDFSAMELLDGDQKQLRAKFGKSAVRDIVQFVEMRKFVVSVGGLQTWDKENLARNVLGEVPSQVQSWMKSKGFQPSMKMA